MGLKFTFKNINIKYVGPHYYSPDLTADHADNPRTRSRR